MLEAAGQIRLALLLFFFLSFPLFFAISWSIPVSFSGINSLPPFRLIGNVYTSLFGSVCGQTGCEVNWHSTDSEAAGRMYLSSDFFFLFFFSLHLIIRGLQSLKQKKKEKEKVNSVQRETSLRTAACLFFCGRQRGVIRGNSAREIKAICGQGSAGLFVFDARFLFSVLCYKGENG